MAINFPGPYELRINYQYQPPGGILLRHQQRLNFQLAAISPTAPGTPFSALIVQERDGGVPYLSAVLNNWLTLIEPLMDEEGCSFVDAEAWHYTPGSFDATFISGELISFPITTKTGSNRPGEQEIYVFRTEEGGIMKVVLQESRQVYGTPKSYADLTASQKAVVDYVISPAAATFLARDTSWPISFKGMFPGQNEVLWKKRNRP